MSASEIVVRFSLDKVTISRAVNSLHGHGFLKRDINGDDKRPAVLRLTNEGCRVSDDIVPLVEELAVNALRAFRPVSVKP